MEKRFIQTKASKKCPDCRVSSKIADFRLIKRTELFGNSVSLEECPSCGVVVVEGENVKRHSLTIEEMINTEEKFKQFITQCPELRVMIFNHLNNKTEETVLQA